MDYIKSEFNRIAIDDNIKYYFRNHNSSLECEITEHFLKVNYKSHIIHVYYELGYSYYGKIRCNFQKGHDLPEFKLLVNNHYKRLFSRKMKSLKVKSNDYVFKRFLELKLQEFGIEKIANLNKFTPRVELVNIKNEYCLYTSYSLDFPDIDEIILPIINLYKSIIDYLEF